MIYYISSTTFVTNILALNRSVSNPANSDVDGIVMLVIVFNASDDIKIFLMLVPYAAKLMLRDRNVNEKKLPKLSATSKTYYRLFFVTSIHFQHGSSSNC